MTGGKTIGGLIRAAILVHAIAMGLWPTDATAQIDGPWETVKGRFPDDARIDRETLFLDPDEVRRIAREASVPMNSRLYTVYRARDGSGVIGYAAVPTIAVRAKPATLLIRLSGAGTVREVSVLTWHGAPRYRPSAAWLEQFKDSSPEAMPRLGDNIEPGSLRQVGATVIIQAVRRFLAIYRLHLVEEGAE